MSSNIEKPGLARSVKHISSSILQAKKSSKSKRVRTIFTPEQLERLEAEFERQQYMVGPERLYLAHTLQLTEAQLSSLNINLTFSPAYPVLTDEALTTEHSRYNFISRIMEISSPMSSKVSGTYDDH
ncbi:hypothetical protein YQE_09943, partial [Dendroctonus ponderosae]